MALCEPYQNRRLPASRPSPGPHRVSRLVAPWAALLFSTRGLLVERGLYPIFHSLEGLLCVLSSRPENVAS